MTVPAVLRRAAACGITQAGLVVHFHPGDDPRLFDTVREEIESSVSDFPGQILLGAEIDIMDQAGTTSWSDDLAGMTDYVLLAMGHTQMPWVRPDLSLPPRRFLEAETTGLMAALDRVPATVVAHPYIYGSLHRSMPGLAYSLRPHEIPDSLVSELAAKLVDSGIRFEYHCRDLLIRPWNLGGGQFTASYGIFLDSLRSLGVNFVAGSDAHYLDQIGRSANAPDWAQNFLAART
jgi:histidinol phosphatase-like PHP family hydrolase